MQVTTLTVNSYTGANKRPHGGYVIFDDGKGYSWGYTVEHDSELDKWVNSEKITLMGSMKLSLGSTNRVFYSAKREAAIKDYLENKY